MDIKIPGLDARFWAKVRRQADGCWVWTGSTRKGYGRVTRGGHQWQAHHLTWCAINGPVPLGLELDHACHDPNACPGGECQHKACVNPDHIRAVTHTFNVQVAVKDRCPAGHPLVGNNVYVNPNPKGGRQCRTCRSARRAHEKQRARDRKRLGSGPGMPGRPRRTVT
jgi:hypothetical protein